MELRAGDVVRFRYGFTLYVAKVKEISADGKLFRASFGPWFWPWSQWIEMENIANVIRRNRVAIKGMCELI
jgi:hypothetical protein